MDNSCRIIDIRLCNFDLCTIINHNILYLTTTDLTTSCTVAFPVKSYYFPCARCRRECRLQLLSSYFVLISLTAQRSAWDLEVLTYKWVLAGLYIITYNATVILSLLQRRYLLWSQTNKRTIHVSVLRPYQSCCFYAFRCFSGPDDARACFVNGGDGGEIDGVPMELR